MRVVYPSTSGQYYHLLREQALDGTKKPLVVFTPKSLLRYSQSGTPLSDLAVSIFQPVMDDPHFLSGSNEGEVHKCKEVCNLLICSGRFFYTLQKMREESPSPHVAIIRVEQLYPFPAKELRRVLDRYSLSCRVSWVQEEPQNMGAGSYMMQQLGRICAFEPEMISRASSAASASGLYRVHELEEKELLAEIFTNPSCGA